MRPLTLAVAAALLLHAQPILAQPVQPAAPDLRLSVTSVGSWRPGDFFRARVAAPGLDAARLRGRSVVLIVNGEKVGSQPLAERTPDGAPYAEFALPWRGLVQTSLAAELADTPIDVVVADNQPFIVQPD